MADREKVIKGLEEIANDQWLIRHADYYSMIATDALELLKEQEAVTPIKARQGRNEYYSYFLCPVCKNDITFHQSYCEDCGRKMKWDED